MTSMDVNASCHNVILTTARVCKFSVYIPHSLGLSRVHFSFVGMLHTISKQIHGQNAGRDMD